MAADASRPSPSPDSYIGSLISLTSKSEIRYEGYLYNINTEESSIGLSNVRSFGTEGRKKDGQQIPAGDKIYEFILFRGSDIKDLQVKASPPGQSATMHNDPAIIQSHYPHPPTVSPSLPSNLPSLGSGTAPVLTSNTAQLGIQRPTFQVSLPTYQTSGSFGAWGATPPPPTANVSGLALPMYWQGYYAPSGGVPHLQQPPLMRPPPGLAMPPMQQPMQFQGMNAPLSSGAPNYPEFPPLFPPFSSSLGLDSPSLPSTVAPIKPTSLTPETSATSVPVKIPGTSLPAPITSGIIPPVSTLTPSMEMSASMAQIIPSVVSSKPGTGFISLLASQPESHSIPLSVDSGSRQAETSVTLVTPNQIMQPTPSIPPSLQSLTKSPKDVVKPPEDKNKPPISERSTHEPEVKTKQNTVSKEPILPLPTPAYHKPNGAVSYANQGSRGRGRGRGSEYARPVAKFTEEFDFTAMNEKFNKDEVWGYLGKSKANSSNREGEDDEADEFDEETSESLKFDVKPVYVKDDFFDTLSCNTSVQASNGRIKFSEQLKIDTETFGNFPRNRTPYGGRGLRGGRGRSSYHGRGYGYKRGRGHSGTNRASNVMPFMDWC